MRRELHNDLILWGNEIGSWDVYYKIPLANGDWKHDCMIYQNEKYSIIHRIVEVLEEPHEKWGGTMRIGINSARWNPENNYGWD